MSLQRQVEIAAERAREIKRERCREEGRVDIIVLVEIYRGPLPVALGFLAANTKTIMRDLGLLITGFDADAVVFCNEGYSQRYEGNNPVTGKPTVMGDYQRLAEQHDGVAKGWVIETLNTFGANRAGDVIAWSDPYSWDGDVPVFQGGHFLAKPQGGLPERLIEIMNHPDTTTAYMKWAGGTEGLPGRTERDVIVGKMLSSQINGHIGLVAYEDQGDRFEELDRVTEGSAFFKKFEL